MELMVEMQKIQNSKTMSVTVHLMANTPIHLMASTRMLTRSRCFVPFSSTRTLTRSRVVLRPIRERKPVVRFSDGHLSQEQIYAEVKKAMLAHDAGIEPLCVIK